MDLAVGAGLLSLLALPEQHGFSCPRKKHKITLSHVLMGDELIEPRSGLRLWQLVLCKRTVGSLWKKDRCRWFFVKEGYPPLEQYITWARTTQCPTVQSHHNMQEYPTYNEPGLLNISYQTIVFYSFSISLLSVFRLVLWGWCLRTNRVYITISQPCTADIFK